MKNLIIAAMLAAGSLLFLTSCEEILAPEVDRSCENGWGTLHVSNKSLHTVQKILIDNTNYGTLDPGEGKEIPLPNGKYQLQFRGINGGSGCSPSFVTIPDCGTVGRSCNH